MNNTSSISKNENSLSGIFYRVFVGILFGFANVIPGVSGGTVMVVLGVYERIIGIITNFKTKIKTEWKFFLPIIIGMGIAIIVFGRLMSDMLSAHKAVTQSFFVGVIVFSIPAIFKSAAFDSDKKLKIKPVCVIAFVLVMALMVFMSLSSANDELSRIKGESAAETEVVSDEVELEETSEQTDAYNPDHGVLTLLLLVVYGAVACSTMIIPGISGSLVMVLMGQYENIMSAIKHFDIITLLPFGIGCLIGLIFCAKLIKWLLTKYSQVTYSAILGFVLGSILSVFPGFDALISVSGIIAFLIGGACIIGCDMLSKRFTK